MAKWVIDNVWATLQDAHPAEISGIHEGLKTRAKDYFRDYKFRAGQWDGYIRYFSLETKRMLAGLVDYVDAMGAVFPREYLTSSPTGELVIPTFPGIEFTPRQREALRMVVDGKLRGIFDMCTGTGKTAIIMATHAMLGKKTLCIVPGKDILSQMQEEAQRFLGRACGQLGSGKCDLDASIILAIDDTLKKIPDEKLNDIMKDIQVLIMDEVHNCTERMHPALEACVNAQYRYGFSGTPFDMGSARSVYLVGHFGPTLLESTTADLINAGRGVPAHFTFIDFDLPHSVRGWNDGDIDYNAIYSDVLLDNFNYHRVVCDLVAQNHDGNTSVLVMVRRTEHGETLNARLNEAGIPADFTHGKQTPAVRKKLRHAFRDSALKVLIASDIYREGVDIPCIDVLILAGGGDSLKDWRQRVGRGLRAHPGKTEVRVYDFYFHGDPIFERHSKNRLSQAMAMPGSRVVRQEDTSKGGSLFPLLSCLKP